MRLTESRLRRIIKNVILENMDDMMDPMMSTDPMDCEECQILCDKEKYLQSNLAKDGCEDVDSAKEFLLYFLDLETRFLKVQQVGKKTRKELNKNTLLIQ